MKIENLEVGMELKNYKELCEVLEIEIRMGTAKKIQLSYLEFYFKFERKGHKYKIIEIYDDSIYQSECPEIILKNKGKGIRKIYNTLLDLNLDFKTNYALSDLYSKNKLDTRFDFAVFKNETLILLIDYSGYTVSENYKVKYLIRHYYKGKVKTPTLVFKHNNLHNCDSIIKEEILNLMEEV